MLEDERQPSQGREACLHHPMRVPFNQNTSNNDTLTRCPLNRGQNASNQTRSLAEAKWSFSLSNRGPKAWEEVSRHGSRLEDPAGLEPWNSSWRRLDGRVRFNEIEKKHPKIFDKLLHATKLHFFG